MTQLLGTIATVYGTVAALTALFQTRQIVTRRESCGVSLRFLGSYVGGYAVWLAYGMTAGSFPLVIADGIGLLCGGSTIVAALVMRGDCSAGARRSNQTPL